MTIELASVRQCSCGVKHELIVEGFEFMDLGDPLDGLYFNCHECGSTLFVPKFKLDPSEIKALNTCPA